jgi:DNA polymerase-3 subunit epsilon
MLDQNNFTIVDVETTGGSPFFSRIIEIGLLRVERGEVVEEFQTLVNPGVEIPEFITRMTGISDRHVKNKPTFVDIAEDLLSKFEDSIFVAHNVAFDYGFLKAEFYRAGLAFSCDTLCTVRLSRALFPEHKRHNLSALIDRYNFRCKRRHRAFDDAMVVWDFLQMASGQFPDYHISQTISRTIKKIPPKQQQKLARQPAGLEYLPDEQ